LASEKDGGAYINGRGEGTVTEEQRLDELLESGQEEELELLSRRKFLTGAVVGGAAGLAVAAGTGVAVWKVSDTEAQVSLEAAQTEIDRLKGLVDLYEDLEKIGLDAILQAGMTALTLPLEAVEQGAKLLKSGLDLVENALLSLKEALPGAQETLLWLEQQVSAVAGGISRIEAAIGNALDKATDNAVGEALKEFAGMVLDYLPFGIGDKIRAVLDGLAELLTSVDELVEGINTNLLEPLRTKWFSTETGEGLGASLINPLVEHVLDPLEAHLADLSELADTWQAKFLAPTEKALAARAETRADIARYKEGHGMS
jgi:hypothetical protein